MIRRYTIIYKDEIECRDAIIYTYIYIYTYITAYRVLVLNGNCCNSYSCLYNLTSDEVATLVTVLCLSPSVGTGLRCISSKRAAFMAAVRLTLRSATRCAAGVGAGNSINNSHT